jgi:hypothetical protein
MTKQVQQVTAFVFGVVFLAVMLAIALFRPDPTPFQYLVFRTTLAVAVGGVVAMIPGFLEARVGKAVRSGGAVAAFIIVFFFSPAKLVATPTPVREHVGFLGDLDEHFKRRVPASEYVLTVTPVAGFDAERFWIAETSDETWEGLIQKICARYSRCMQCRVDRRSANLALTSDLETGTTREGVKMLQCRAAQT